MPHGAEDLACVSDPDGVVGGGVHHDQRPFQRADLFAQVGRPDVLDEVPPQGERLAADQERRLPFGEDSFGQRRVSSIYRNDCRAGTGTAS